MPNADFNIVSVYKNVLSEGIIDITLLDSRQAYKEA